MPVASAQGSNNRRPEQPLRSTTTPKVINIWPGVAPGSEQWKQKETTLGSGSMQRIVNVTTPTLTAYLPDPAKATGTAVIIAPGGGFIFLGTDTHETAEWLATRGIAEDGRYGIADGIQSIKVVRAHAAELGVLPDRIVFMGFSAGGIITEYTAVQPDESARPNYAAPIYGAPFPAPPPIPKGLPPFFMEMPQDDNLAGPYIVAFYDALKAAGYKPEFHIYEHGGHGWSMRKQGTTSDHWIEEFYWWLEAHALTQAQK